MLKSELAFIRSVLKITSQSLCYSACLIRNSVNLKEFYLVLLFRKKSGRYLCIFFFFFLKFEVSLCVCVGGGNRYTSASNAHLCPFENLVSTQLEWNAMPGICCGRKQKGVSLVVSCAESVKQGSSGRGHAARSLYPG